MNFLQILQLVTTLAPAGISVTTDIIKLIQEIEAVLALLPTEHQAAVANVAAKALVART